MKGQRLDRSLRGIAIVAMGLALSAMVGVGTGRWALSETSGFYTHPVDRGPPLYARQRPVADDFWAEQAGSYTPAANPYGDYATGVGSTATNVTPAYLSASGS